MNCRVFLLIFLAFVAGVAATTVATPKIVIVGAGAAGIAAASRLLEHGFHDIIILEAEDRIGGRVYTTDLDGYAVDLGAQWVHGAIENVVYELAAPLDLLEHSSKESMRIELRASDGSELDPTLANETLTFYFETLENSFNDTDNCNGSIGDYFVERFQEFVTKDSSTYINESLKNDFLWYLNLLQTGLDGSDTWFDVSAKEYSEYWEHEGDDRMINWKERGYSTILDVLMKKLPNPENELPVMEKLLLNAEVAKVDYTEDMVKVITSDGREFVADHVIMTPSLGVLKAEHQTMFNPPLSEEKVNSIEGIGFGAAGKILLAFNETWWDFMERNFHSLSFLWTEEDRKEYESDPMTRWIPSIAAVSVVENKPRLLHIWISGEGARDADLVPEDLLFNQTTFLLHKLMSNMYNVSAPVAMKRNQWTTNKHFLGTYSFRSLETERRNASTEALAAPIVKSGKPIVLFAGEATNTHYFSTVHGAVGTGFREANRLLEYYNDVLNLEKSNV